MTTILALSCIFARRALASRVVTAVFRPCYRVVCWRCQHLAEGVPDAVARQQPMQRFSSCFFTLKRHVQVVILVRKFISACFWSWIRWQFYRRNFLSPADCVLIGGRMSLFDSLVLSTLIGFKGQYGINLPKSRRDVVLWGWDDKRPTELQQKRGYRLFQPGLSTVVYFFCTSPIAAHS